MGNGNRSLGNENTKTGVETHELIFAFHGGERVHDRTSVRLHGGGYISCIPEVGTTNEEERGISKREGGELGMYRTHSKS
jgi:hypothetical protein